MNSRESMQKLSTLPNTTRLAGALETSGRYLTDYNIRRQPRFNSMSLNDFSDEFSSHSRRSNYLAFSNNNYNNNNNNNANRNNNFNSNSYTMSDRSRRRTSKFNQDEEMERSEEEEQDQVLHDFSRDDWREQPPKTAAKKPSAPPRIRRDDYDYDRSTSPHEQPKPKPRNSKQHRQAPPLNESEKAMAATTNDDDDIIDISDQVNRIQSKSAKASSNKHLDGPMPATQIKIKARTTGNNMVDGRREPMRANTNDHEKENMLVGRKPPAVKSATQGRFMLTSSSASSLNNDTDRESDEENENAIIHPDEERRRATSSRASSLSRSQQRLDAVDYFTHPIFECLKYDTLDFIQMPAPRDIIIKCKLLCVKDVFREHIMYLESFKGFDLAVLKSKRKKMAAQIYYYIKGLQLNKDRKSSIDFGRLNSTLNRKCFNLSSKVEQRTDTKKSLQTLGQDQEDELSANKNFFDLRFNNRLFGPEKPKDFLIDALINDTSSNNNNNNNDTTTTTRVRSFDRSSSIESDSAHQYFRRITQRMSMTNKKPEYDPLLKKYRLDFRGRANVASVNNIQIVDPKEPDRIIFQLGKVKKYCYNLDYSYPLCAFQAFGIAISCLSRN